MKEAKTTCRICGATWETATKACFTKDHKDPTANPAAEIARSLHLEERWWIEPEIGMYAALDQGEERFRDWHRSQMDHIEIFDRRVIKLHPTNYGQTGWLVTIEYFITDYEAFVAE